MNLKRNITRAHAESAFARRAVRHGEHNAQQKLADAVGVTTVAQVPDDKLVAAFDALNLPAALLRALGVKPIATSIFPPRQPGGSTKDRLNEMAKAIYSTAK
jgi:hypothetical protein